MSIIVGFEFLCVIHLIHYRGLYAELLIDLTLSYFYQAQYLR
jgi:hypothetical protein